MKRRAMKGKAFEAPTIYGVLCDEAPAVPRGLAQRLKARDAESVLLPFRIEGRHLRNVITCMRLMDIRGLVALGRHRSAIVPTLPRVDLLATHAGSVDTIIRRGTEFLGCNAAALAFRRWLRRHVPCMSAPRDAWIAGSDPQMGALAAALLSEGYRVVRIEGGTRPREKLPRAVRTVSRPPASALPSILIAGKVEVARLRRLEEMLAGAPHPAMLLDLSGVRHRADPLVRTLSFPADGLAMEIHDTCVDLLTNSTPPAI